MQSLFWLSCGLVFVCIGNLLPIINADSTPSYACSSSNYPQYMHDYCLIDEQCLGDPSAPKTDDFYIPGACRTCPYPWAMPGIPSGGYTCVDYDTEGTARTDQCQCTGIYFNAEISIFVISAIIFIILLISIYSSTNFSHDFSTTIALLYVILIPTIDVVSDIAFILRGWFNCQIIFILAIFFVVLPTCHFVVEIYHENARMKWYILEPPGYLLDQLLEESSFRFDSFGSIFITFLIKMKYICYLFPWIFINLIIIIPLYLYGSLLFSTKLLVLKGPRNLWYRLWTGNNQHDIKVTIDTTGFNLSFYMGVFLESIPQMLIVITNQFLLNYWTTVSILSLTFSLLSIANSLYCFWYLKMIKGLEIKELPIKIPFFGVLMNDNSGNIFLGKDHTLEDVQARKRYIRKDELDQELQPLIQTIEQLKQELHINQQQIQYLAKKQAIDLPISNSTNQFMIVDEEEQSQSIHKESIRSSFEIQNPMNK